MVDRDFFWWRWLRFLGALRRLIRRVRRLDEYRDRRVQAGDGASRPGESVGDQLRNPHATPRPLFIVAIGAECFVPLSKQAKALDRYGSNGVAGLRFGGPPLVASFLDLHEQRKRRRGVTARRETLATEDSGEE